MLEFIKEGIVKIDYFGQPVRITLNRQKNFKTLMGGSTSLLIFSFIIYLIIMNGMNLLNRKQPKTSATNIHQFESPLINITKLKKFFGAYFLTNQFVPFFDPSYFNYEIFQFMVERDDNGNSNISFIPLEIKNCSIYFEDLKKKSFGDDFLQNSLHEGVCFDTGEKELVIGGKFTGNYFSNILFRFNKCQNKTKETKTNSHKFRNLENADFYTDEKVNILINSSNHNDLLKNSFYNSNYKSELKSKFSKEIQNNIFKKTKILQTNTINQTLSSNSKDVSESKIGQAQNKKDIVCKSEEEIDNKIQGGFFQFYYLDNNIDLNNFENPYTEYFSRYFILLDPGSQKFVDLYYKTVNITSDAGIIFENPIVNTSMIFDYYREQIDTFSKSKKIIELLVNSSNNILKYNIIFTKFQDFAASIGGLMNVLLQVGSFITLFFNDFKMNEKIINNLYTFNNDEMEGIKKVRNLDTSNVSLNNKRQANKFENNPNKDDYKNNMKKDFELNCNNYFTEHNSNFQNQKLQGDIIDMKVADNMNPKTFKDLPYSSKFTEQKVETSEVNLDNSSTKKNKFFFNNSSFPLKNEFNASNKLVTDINQNEKKIIHKDFRDLIENPQIFETNKIKCDNSEKHFHRNQEKLNQQNNFLFKTSNNLIQNPQKLICDSNNNLYNPNDLKFENFFKNETNRKIYLNKLNDLKMQKSHELHSTWYEIILLKLCPFSKRLKAKRLLYTKAKDELFQYLDFMEIVNNLQEFNKLKKILFSKDELGIFNFHTKSFLRSEGKVFDESTRLNCDEYQIDMLIKYKNIKEKNLYDEKIKNLLDLFDPEIKRYFDEILLKIQE